MSLTDISRTCFQSGVSATRWIALCKTFIAQNPSIHTNEENAQQISNSVLVLYHAYPAEPRLSSYLKHAIEDGILPLPIYVSTFLEASSSFNSVATLDVLCEIAVTMHEATGQIPYEDSLRTLLDAGHCLKLMQLSYSMPLPGRHQKLIPNAGKLLTNLLLSVSDFTQLPPQEVWKQSYSVDSLQHEPRLDPAVKDLLASLKYALTYVETEDVPKPVRDAQMIQHMQATKGDIGGPNSENDVITLGLLWQYLVNMRGHDFGAGHTMHAVALLISTWRSSSWPAQVFYTQVFVSAFSCAASGLGSPLLWKAFIVGRLPALLAAFQAVIGADQTVDWRGALQHGLRMAFRRPDLVASGDQFLSQGAEGMGSPFTHEMLQQLTKLNVIEQVLCLELDPSALNQAGSGATYLDTALLSEGSTEIATLESKFNQDLESPDVGWFDRVTRDVGIHPTFANFVLKKFAACSKSLDVEALSSICRLLYSHPFALDLLALHVNLSDVIFNSLFFLEKYECESVGDPQTAVGHLGNVVLFVQYVLGRFQLELDVYVKEAVALPVDFLRETHKVFAVESLSSSESASFYSWFKALFDSSSEGIEDSILRSTDPKTLLRIAATLFHQAIKAASTKKIDAETLLNGVSYFTGPLLNWTLVGVVEALIRDAQSTRDPSPETLEVLQTLLLSPSCPTPVHALCRTSVLRYLADKKDTIDACPNFKVAAVKDAVRGSKGPSKESAREPNGSPASPPSIEPALYVQQRIHAALTIPQAGKISELDVDVYLRMLPPTRLIRAVLERIIGYAGHASSQQNPAVLSQILESCRRVGTFVLTMPMRNVFVHDARTTSPSSSSSSMNPPALKSPPQPSLSSSTSSNSGGIVSSGSRTSSGPQAQTAVQHQHPRVPTTRICPPILPLFLHVVLPGSLASLDRQMQGPQSGDPARMVELLTSLIVSCLTSALQLEWALATVAAVAHQHTATSTNTLSSMNSGSSGGSGGPGGMPGSSSSDANANLNVKAPSDATANVAQKVRPPCVLGSTSSAMARRLAAELKMRQKESTLCSLILQRLGSSESFVGNFPYFGLGIEGGTA